MRRRAVVAPSAALNQRFAGDLFEVVCVAFRGRVVMMHAMFFTSHAQMMPASTTIVLKLLILKVFERFGLLKFLDELHVVLKRINFARVTTLSNARILRRYVIRGAILRRLVPTSLVRSGQFATLCGHNRAICALYQVCI